MIMKKGITIFSIILVTIALMASMLIPHHHHGDEVCFVDSHCEAACDSHEYNNTSHNQPLMDMQHSCLAI